MYVCMYTYILYFYITLKFYAAVHERRKINVIFFYKKKEKNHEKNALPHINHNVCYDGGF